MLIDLIAKFSGINAFLNAINGYKAYIGGAALLLAGGAQLLTEIVALNGASSWLAFVQHLSADPAIANIGLGLTALGLRHAISKQDAAAQ